MQDIKQLSKKDNIYSKPLIFFGNFGSRIAEFFIIWIAKVDHNGNFYGKDCVRLQLSRDKKSIHMYSAKNGVAVGPVFKLVYGNKGMQQFTSI